MHIPIASDIAISVVKHASLRIHVWETHITVTPGLVMPLIKIT